jgi:hypothetical protein
MTDHDDIAALLDRAADLAGPGDDLAARAEARGRRRIARRRATAAATLAVAVTLGTVAALRPSHSALPPAVRPSASVPVPIPTETRIVAPYIPVAANAILRRFALEQHQDIDKLAERTLLAQQHGRYTIVVVRAPARDDVPAKFAEIWVSFDGRPFKRHAASASYDRVCAPEDPTCATLGSDLGFATASVVQTQPNECLTIVVLPGGRELVGLRRVTARETTPQPLFPASGAITVTNLPADLAGPTKRRSYCWRLWPEVRMADGTIYHLSPMAGLGSIKPS